MNLWTIIKLFLTNRKEFFEYVERGYYLECSDCIYGWILEQQYFYDCDIAFSWDRRHGEFWVVVPENIFQLESFGECHIDFLILMGKHFPDICINICYPEYFLNHCIQEK